MVKKIVDVIDEIIVNAPLKIVLSNVKNKDVSYKKIVFTAKEIRNAEVFQIERYTKTQVFHMNIEKSSLKEELLAVIDGYKQLNVFFKSSSWEVKSNRNGECIINKQESIAKIMPKGNNREKNYILKEGENIPVFVELGIFTKEYKVVNSMYDKFKQINRFAELVDDVLKNYNKDEINIIDFGCGKSYLTFVLYYYLVEKKKIKANIIGLDLKKDVINKCNNLARKFGYNDLRFEVGDINGYKAEFEVDMVVTLHACDTATDYALYNAINWKAGVILSVPCCQHEINKQMKSDNLSGLTKYGIVKERTAALITDAIRGCMLEYSGYKTELLEFVDLEYSPKNIMIRARKANISEENKERSLTQARNLCEEFGLKQTLMEKLC
ncbi:MAG: SAM-dependent methyltransferase [Lachnospiraceae bacterium]|nr:SAM-dependent methyltransferase [Lachnospiraceae bacterium]